MLRGAKKKYLVIRTHGLAAHLLDPEEIRSWVFVDDDATLFDKISPTDYGTFFEGPQDLRDVARIEEASLRVSAIRTRGLLSRARGTDVERLIRAFMLRYDIENLRRIIFSLLYGRGEEELRLLPVDWYVLDIGRLSKAKSYEELLDMVREPRLAGIISEWLSSERDVRSLDLSLDAFYFHYLLEFMKVAKVRRGSPVRSVVMAYLEGLLLMDLLKSKYLGIPPTTLRKAFGKLPFRRLMSVSDGAESLEEFLDELVNLAPYKSLSVEIRNAMKEVGEPWVIEHVVSKRTYNDALRIALKSSLSEAYILMYLIALQWEAQSIKTVMLGRISGVEPEVLYRLLAPPSE